MWTAPAAAVPRHKDDCIHGGTQHGRESARVRCEPGPQGRLPCAPRGAGWASAQIPSAFLRLISVENFNLLVKREIKAGSERISHRTACLLSD